MRVLSFITATTIAAMTITSCGSFSKTTASQQNSYKPSNSIIPSASSNGRAAGVALHSLYGQYQRDGRLDMGNISNIINLATLANNLQGLKGQTDNSAFYKDFATGLVLGSNNLITQNNSQKVMNGLTNLVNSVDMSGLKKVAENAAGQAAEAAKKGNEVVENASTIATSVGNILSIFKK